MAGADKLMHARRRDRDPVLVVLDLFGDAHLHGCTSLPCPPVLTAPLPEGPGAGGLLATGQRSGSTSSSRSAAIPPCWTAYADKIPTAVTPLCRSPARKRRIAWCSGTHRTSRCASSCSGACPPRSDSGTQVRPRARHTC